jgi:hypothetical protein
VCVCVCVCVRVCVCEKILGLGILQFRVYMSCEHLPPRAHPHSPTHTDARTHTHAAPALSVCVLLLLPPQDKNTPLHWAAIIGHKDVAELLLGHKADVNSVGKVSAPWGGGRGFVCVCVCVCLCMCV